MHRFNYPPINHIEIRDGQARIVGKPLKVKMVISRLIHGNASVEEVMEQYNLTRAQVLAALAYYFDYKEALDRDFEEEEQLVRQNVLPLDDLLTRWRSKPDRNGQ